jgi:hypothetical protein
MPRSALTVRELLGHRAATDGLVAAALGLPVQPPVEPGEKEGQSRAA